MSVGANMRPLLPKTLQGDAAVADFLQTYADTCARLLRERPELRGEGAHCPCCGGVFARFDPFRHKPEHPWRQNAKCPVCGSLERHRRLWLQLCREEALFAGGRLLHFAPEAFLRGLFTAAGRHDYVDCDLQAQRAGQNVDITALPFATASFQWCICSHVLEHVDDDGRALAEMARVLASGATAWLLVPTMKSGTVYHDPPPEGFTPDDHRREYGLQEFVGMCREAGFDVELLHARDIDPELRARHVLSNHIYRCVRR